MINNDTIIPLPNDTIEDDSGQTRPLLDLDDLADPNNEDGATRSIAEATPTPPSRPENISTSKSGPRKRRVITGRIKTGQILQKRYQLTTILGTGGFGAVYLTEDIKLKRECVVKQMLISKDKSDSQIELYQANFERESCLLVQLNLTQGYINLSRWLRICNP